MGSGNPQGKQEAKELMDAVGAEDTEGEDGNPTTLRQALYQRANQDASQADELKKKAGDVRTKYTEVSGKFDKVQGQNEAQKYKDDDQPDKYQAVVKAWNAFN